MIDTAGRLQNKKNLMEEYKKIINVLKKIDESFPNEVILVLDATTGQNALNQVEEFSKIHRWDSPRDFKENWMEWIQQKKDLIDMEKNKLINSVYKGVIY